MDKLLSIDLFVQQTILHKTFLPLWTYNMATKTKRPPKQSRWEKLRSRMFYPWDKWCDGKKHILKPGKDFKVTPRHMASAIYSYARRNKLKATVSLVDGVVTFLVE